jgi:hypothetical protein
LMAGFAHFTVANPLTVGVERHPTTGTILGNGAWGGDRSRRNPTDLPATVLPCSSFRNENCRTGRARGGDGEGRRDLRP